MHGQQNIKCNQIFFTAQINFKQLSTLFCTFLLAKCPQNMKEYDHLEYAGMDGKILCLCMGRILGKYCVYVWGGY
jgi:hypothetical protein